MPGAGAFGHWFAIVSGSVLVMCFGSAILKARQIAGLRSSLFSSVVPTSVSQGQVQKVQDQVTHEVHQVAVTNPASLHVADNRFKGGAHTVSEVPAALDTVLAYPLDNACDIRDTLDDPGAIDLIRRFAVELENKDNV